MWAGHPAGTPPRFPPTPNSIPLVLNSPWMVRGGRGVSEHKTLPLKVDRGQSWGGPLIPRRRTPVGSPRCTQPSRGDLLWEESWWTSPWELASQARSAPCRCRVGRWGRRGAPPPEAGSGPERHCPIWGDPQQPRSRPPSRGEAEMSHRGSLLTWLWAQGRLTVRLGARILGSDTGSFWHMLSKCLRPMIKCCKRELGGQLQSPNQLSCSPYSPHSSSLTSKNSCSVGECWPCACVFSGAACPACPYEVIACTHTHTPQKCDPFSRVEMVITRRPREDPMLDYQKGPLMVKLKMAET